MHFAHALKLESNNSAALKGRQAVDLEKFGAQSDSWSQSHAQHRILSFSFFFKGHTWILMVENFCFGSLFFFLIPRVD